MYDVGTFAVLIPSHGRSGKVATYRSLRNCGYTGAVYIVCDDEDQELDAYQKEFEGRVMVFSKDEYAGTFDKMDNFGNKACVVYARNAIFDLAKKAGLKYFCVADDDYSVFQYRIRPDFGYYAKTARNTDDLFSAYVRFMEGSGVDTICFAQGGDYIGGAGNGKVVDGFAVSRKMMNLYFFDVEKPIKFIGTINEDLTSSVTEGVIGKTILTSYMNSIVQGATQKNAGGLTEIYLELGTYIKSFYSVMAAPSCIKVAVMGSSSKRLHHAVTWNDAVPKIIREKHRKKNVEEIRNGRN